MYNHNRLSLLFVIQPIEVRFIEYMPFDGNRWNDKKLFGFQETIKLIQQRWPDFKPLEDEPNATAKVSRKCTVLSISVISADHQCSL